MSLPPDKPPKRGRRGVEAWSVDEDGRELVILTPPWQNLMQWPGVSISSHNFDKLEPWAKLYEQAIAFLNAAKILSKDAGTKGATGETLTWPQGSVCYYSLHIATELFLKACIWAHSGEIPHTHDLKKLRADYAKVFPEKEFQFSIPLAWLNAPTFQNFIDRAPDQLYRYHVGKDGKASAATHIFRPDTVFNRVTHLESVWRNAWHTLPRRALPPDNAPT